MLNSKIRSIAAAHADWLQSSGVLGQRADFSALDLSMADFSGLDLSDGLFVGTRLDRANLSGCNLARGDFRGANLACANLARANLSGANLTEVQASLAGFENAVLSKAIVDMANFDSARFISADFSLARGQRVKFDSANLAHASFDGVSLENVSFIKANLTNASVCDASLFSVALVGAVVVGVDFGKAEKIVGIESGEWLLHRSQKPGDVELTNQQMRRMKRMWARKFGVRKIAREMNIPHDVVQAKINQLEKEPRDNLNAVFSRVGKIAFITAGSSVIILLASGFLDVFHFINRQSSVEFGGQWYFLWLALCFFSAGVGIHLLFRRQRLVQEVPESSASPRAERTSGESLEEYLGKQITPRSINETRGAN